MLVWVVALLCACLLALAFWALVAGDREGQMVDEEPTLDVENHIGDSRPTRWKP